MLHVILLSFEQGAATQFQTREYIRDRNKIEEALFKAVKERLGGVCCELGCTKTGKWSNQISSFLTSFFHTENMLYKIHEVA